MIFVFNYNSSSDKGFFQSRVFIISDLIVVKDPREAWKMENSYSCPKNSCPVKHLTSLCSYNQLELIDRKFLL